MSVMMSLNRQKPDFTFHSAISLAYKKFSLPVVDSGGVSASILDVTGR